MTTFLENNAMLDPFVILGLEKSFALDIKFLEKAYFDAQKKTHPDQFVNATEEKKREAIQQSSLVNQAYLTLKDPLKRAEFLLKEVGINPLSHDPIVLEEVMGWREQVAAGKPIKQELIKTENTLSRELEGAFEKKDHEAVRRILYRLTYIQKLLKEEF